MCLLCVLFACLLVCSCSCWVELGDLVAQGRDKTAIYALKNNPRKVIKLFEDCKTMETEAKRALLLAGHDIPNLINYERGESSREGKIGIIMKRAEGRKLSELLGTGGKCYHNPEPLDRELTWLIVEELLKIVDHLCEAKVVHHDINYHNILVQDLRSANKGVQVSLIDLGEVALVGTPFSSTRCLQGLMPPHLKAAGEFMNSCENDVYQVGVAALRMIGTSHPDFMKIYERLQEMLDTADTEDNERKFLYSVGKDLEQSEKELLYLMLSTRNRGMPKEILAGVRKLLQHPLQQEPKRTSGIPQMMRKHN